MNNEFIDIIDCLTDRKAINYIARTESEVTVKTDINQVVRDLSWIDMLEQSIPFIDQIVRNPRRFIVQEEEIIPVEKTRKVTEESIKHLAKHTSLIQDIDKDGDVKPLKLLNVFKEETTDLYENRFIYSLIINTKTFLNNQLQAGSFDLKSKYVKTTNYKGETKLVGEKVKYNLEIKNEYKDSSEEDNKNDSIEERLSRIIEIFNDFLGTQFIKGLSSVTPVRSPIRKTNVILKDKNFIKAVELWEFLEKFDIEESVKVVSTSKEEEVYNLAEKMSVASFIQYDLINKINKKSNDKEYKFSAPYLKKILEAYISEHPGSEKEFKNMLTKEFKNIKIKKEKEYLEIKNIMKDNVNRHKDRIKNSLNFLK